MTKELSKEIVAYSLQVMQSAIEKTLNELLTEESIDVQYIELIYSQYSAKETALKIKRFPYSKEQSTKSVVYVKYSLENRDIWFSFPKHSTCEWTNIYFDSIEEMKIYLDYLNSQYDYLSEDCFYNRKSNILFSVFHVEKNNLFTIVAMKNNKSAKVIKTLFEWSL